MPALKEFANFITLNTANLADTYAQLLEENGGGYESISKRRRVSSARKLLKAVTESYESESAVPLARLFDAQADDDMARWPQDVDPPQPMLEVECLGQTLAPVVTNLESSKFLWQLLSEVRLIVSQSIPTAPAAPVVETPPAVPPTRPLSPPPESKPKRSSLDTAPLVDKTETVEKITPPLPQDTTIAHLLISVDEAVMLLDEKGFIDCNEATLKIFGYNSKDQFINTHPSEQSPPQQLDGQDSMPAANERIATAYREGSNRFEWLHCRADGTPFPAEVILTRVEFEGRQILQAIVRDITRYKETEQAVQESERWFRTIMDSVQAGIVIVDAETREIVDANPAALEKIGAEKGTVVGSICHQFICPAEKDRCPVCDLGQTVDNSERVLLTADGKTIPIIKNVVTVEIEGRKYLVESFVDITEQKETAEENMKFRLGIEHSHDAFFMTDIDGTIVFANAAFEEVYGFTPGEALGQTPRILKSGLIPPEQYKHFWDTLLSGQTVAGQLINKTKDGQLITVAATNTPILNEDGELLGFLAIHRDVSDQVATEQTLAKRARELETVAEVGTVISTIFDTQELLQTVVDLVRERFELYHAHVYLLNSVKDTLNLVAGAGEKGRNMVSRGWHIPLHKEQSLVARAARTELGFIVNNVQEEPGWLPNPDLPETRAELAVPLVLGGQVLGVLDVQSDKVGYFQDEDLHIQTILGAQVAVAIQNAEQYEKTNAALTESEVLAREQTVLYELGQALTARLDVDQVLEEAYRQASRLIDTSNFYIGLYDPEKEEISFPFLVSDSEIDRDIKIVPVTEGIAGYMVRNKASLLFEDDVRAKQEAIGIAMVGEEAQSWLGVPLMIGDRVLGVMAVQSFTSPRLFDEHSRELLSAIGSQVAIALQNATLFENIVKAQVEAEERLKETQILQKFTQALSATLEVNGVIDAFFEASTALIGADYAIFSLVDRTQRRVKAISGLNVTEDHLRRANHPLDSDDIMADIVRTGQTELITGWDDRFDINTFTAEGMEEWGLKIFTPISIRQQNVGLVEVGFKEKVEATVQETQVELLRTLIDQAAIALESVQRYEASQKAARREQTIREITENVRAASSLEELVQQVTIELGQYFSAEYAVVELGVEDEQSAAGSGSGQNGKG
jgi:PAS domain S-box-containing protein